MKNLIVAIFVCSVCLVSSRSTDKKTDTSTFLPCETARRMYKNAGSGYKEDDIYNIEQSGSSLKVCASKKTCCKAAAERNLSMSSEKTRNSLTNPLQNTLKGTFELSETKFRGFFQLMMIDSQKNLNSMFNKTYGDHYTKNSYVFDDLYKSLGQYINGSELSLKMKFDTFFSNLHEKIYVMSKVWLSFDDKYKNCIRDKTHSIQPFGEKQMRISYQTTRAFEASRTFLQALKEGMGVSKKLLNMPVHEQCRIAFMKMTQCATCSGVPENTKPCANYCLNVMKGCYAYIFMIQGRWSKYVTAMINLAGKLEGPFNLEALVVPLGVKISEAIMAFQDNQQNVTHKVEASCGKAPFSALGGLRKRRNAEKKKEGALHSLRTNSEELISPGDQFQSNTDKIINSLKAGSVDTKDKITYPAFMKTEKTREPSDFEQLLSSTKKSLNELKDYWMTLPSTLCNNGMASDKNVNCWNGENATGYNKQVVDDAVFNLFNSNPEMMLNNQPGDNVILMQVEKLKVITAKLNSVIAGNGVNCVDCDLNEGSGVNVIIGENNDDEELNNNNKNTGSGSTPGGSGVSSGESEDVEGSGVIPTATPPAKTPKVKCHINDVNCNNDPKTNDGENTVEDFQYSDDPLPIWDNTVQDPKSSGTMLFTNVFVVFVCMLMSFL